MSGWWADRVKNGIVYVIASVLACLVVGFCLWKIFFQKTFTQKTVVQAGGVANYWLKDAQIKVGFGGCASFPPAKGDK